MRVMITVVLFLMKMALFWRKTIFSSKIDQFFKMAPRKRKMPHRTNQSVRPGQLSSVDLKQKINKRGVWNKVVLGGFFSKN